MMLWAVIFSTTALSAGLAYLHGISTAKTLAASMLEKYAEMLSEARTDTEPD